MNLINYSAIAVGKMSKKQKLALTHMNPKTQMTYLMSFLGVRTSAGTEIPLPASKVKPLSDFQAIRRSIMAQYNIDNLKKPHFSAPDWVGIEIECYLPCDNFDMEDGDGECDGSCRDDCTCYDCSECGHRDDNAECNCECNRHCGGLGNGDGSNGVSSVKRSIMRAKIKGIGVDTDGSLNSAPDGYFGIEIKILTRISDTKNLEKLCAWLKNNEAKVNTSCGLHVHLDVSQLEDETVDKIKNTFEKLLPVMLKMVPPSRRDNRYCVARVADTKYSAINTSTIASYGTIEVRLHNGTTDLAKILNWIMFLQKIKTFGISPTVSHFHVNSMGSMLKDVLALDDDNYKFLRARIAKFRGDDGLNESDMGSEESAA